MATTRRTLIAALGLAPVSAVGAETFLPPVEPSEKFRSVTGAYDKERFAAAFESLAREIRHDNVDVFSLRLLADLSPNQIADKHTLTFEFVFRPEA